jgi:general secretion pathway protein G
MDGSGYGGRMSDRRGFTLVEMMIVIAVVLILASLMVGLIVVITDRAHYTKTEAVVKMLDDACKNYKQQYNTYPANDKGDSRCFHYYLGQERTIQLDTDSGVKTKRPPILEFKADMLDLPENTAPDARNPAPVIDAWGQKVQYKNPGQYNSKHVDIWSSGKNGKDELDPTDKNFDDVVNWMKIEG